MAEFDHITIPECKKLKHNIYEGVVGPVSHEEYEMIYPALEETDRDWARQDGSKYYVDPLIKHLIALEEIS
jgi:coenzyme F420-reducing hydrogenase beta subunit